MSVVGLRREVVALVGRENAASGGAGEMGPEHERIRRGRRCKQCAPCLRGPRRDRRPRAPSTPNDGIGSGGAARIPFTFFFIILPFFPLTPLIITILNHK